MQSTHLVYVKGKESSALVVVKGNQEIPYSQEGKKNGFRLGTLIQHLKVALLKKPLYISF